jgi:hypothetical protein
MAMRPLLLALLARSSLSPDTLSSARRQCSAVSIAPEFGGLALFAGAQATAPATCAHQFVRAAHALQRAQPRKTVPTTLTARCAATLGPRNCRWVHTRQR